MSYDLLVFEQSKAPRNWQDFLEWYSKEAWGEDDQDDEDELASLPIHAASEALQNWFMEMKDIFPPSDGEYAPDSARLLADEELLRHMADYHIRPYVIYVEFAWSLAEEADVTMLNLAKKHRVGFYDVSGADGSGGDIIFPDGSIITRDNGINDLIYPPIFLPPK